MFSGQSTRGYSTICSHFTFFSFATIGGCQVETTQSNKSSTLVSSVHSSESHQIWTENGGGGQKDFFPDRDREGLEDKHE